MRSNQALAAAAILMLARPLLAAELFVSPTGNDANTGTRDKPLQSFATATKAVRSSPAHGKEPITVWFAPGSYYLPEPITFTAPDSGTPAAPITYASTGGTALGGPNAAILSGGQKLDGLKWEPYKDGILKTQVPAGLTTDQLFINGQRQILARYPNYDPNQKIFNGFAADAISPARAKTWADPTGGFIHAMHQSLWGDYSYQITGKDATGNLTYIGGWQNNRPGRMHPQDRMVEGIFEELDAPSEWFLNTKTNTLYFIPPLGMSAADLAQATVEVVRLRELVEFQGTQAAPVKNITLKGFTFRHTARTFMDNKEPLLRSDWTIYRGGALFFNGAEDCSLNDCFLDQLGGNAVFVNKYNRRVTVTGCQIANAGSNGVAFVGDPNAVRSPLFQYDQRIDYTKLDLTPGPKTDNYPANCLVDNCLIYLSGRVEKQTAPIEISMSQGITIRHCSIYDVPRAGINICDGCWGGDVVEFCDIFDTVQETGDHGSFNSWGRDRFWDKDEKVINAQVAKNPALPLLDVITPITLRNNRWRCENGWDIDLDDGSSNYIITGNLCLNGGIKFREGYDRVGQNNILIRDSLNAHVWLKNSQDVFSHNIVGTNYKPVNMPAPPWGKEVDSNFLAGRGTLTGGTHNASGDPLFTAPATGDFTVKENSPALAVGFKNFPMDQFGVTSPALKAIAKTPSFGPPPARNTPIIDDTITDFLGAKVKNVTTLGEQSATGLPSIAGILFLDVPTESFAAKAGIRKMDVILQCAGKPIKTLGEIEKLIGTPKPGDKITLGVMRTQSIRTIQMQWNQ